MQNQTIKKQNLLKHTWLFLSFVLLSSMGLFAQNLTVSGTVSDSRGEALPGVTVVTKGAAGGTVSDVNGNYTLGSVPASGTLVFSFIGMKTQEIAVNGMTAINVTLLEDAIAIDEVVAVGYGTVKKRDVIGSVASVSGEDLKQVSSTSFTAAMQGRAAGVNIRETSGTPGAPISVQVRGVNSINTGTDPLWIIDGMPV